MNIGFNAEKGLGGVLIPPPDKSLTHRALMLSSISSGISTVIDPLKTGDCLSTIGCLKSLGVEFSVRNSGEDNRGGASEKKHEEITVHGRGLHGFREPCNVLDAGNSGTTMRLLAGLLAGLPLYAVMTGDNSLLKRPMKRVVEPLRAMGGNITGRDNGSYAPLTFLPGDGLLMPVDYELPVSSAQVKSSVLFAGLRSKGTIVLTGKIHSRDHTERMFKAIGLPVTADGEMIKLEPVVELPAFDFRIPGDISSASFFIAGALLSGKELKVIGCGINPTRTGFIRVLKRMGADIVIEETEVRMGEPVGVITVKPSSLYGTTVTEEEIPDLIDEIPLIAALAVSAEGKTVVSGAEELKHKETDRLATTADMIESLKGTINVFSDGFMIRGPQKLKPGVVESGGDHRIAMAGAVLSAYTGGTVDVNGFDAAAVSYPNFIEHFIFLGGKADE